jgi:hypothetical protein
VTVRPIGRHISPTVGKCLPRNGPSPCPVWSNGGNSCNLLFINISRKYRQFWHLFTRLFCAQCPPK